MPEPRSIGESRPTITFVVLIVLSLISLASGARGEVLGSAIKTTVGVVSMPFLTALDAVKDGSGYVTGLFTDYNSLRDEIHEFNLKFTEQQQRTSDYYELRAENERLRVMLDFERVSTQFDLMAAEILQHSKGVLTIDRGSIHGVKESMCVVAPEGIIGLVTQVGPFSSNVITLQNPDCRVDAMIERNRVRGQVQGTANAMSSVCTMHYIDLNSNVSKNDLVVTSPDSVFPSGFPIGRVIADPEDPEGGQLAQSANILPLADPFRIDEVFILLSADPDADEMTRGSAELDVVIVPGELMDTASIQERFAP